MIKFEAAKDKVGNSGYVCHCIVMSPKTHECDVAEVFRSDLWNISAVKHIAAELNSKKIPLNPDQKSLASYIRGAIRKETQRQCDEWNAKYFGDKPLDN